MIENAASSYTSVPDFDPRLTALSDLIAFDGALVMVAVV